MPEETEESYIEIVTPYGRFRTRTKHDIKKFKADLVGPGLLWTYDEQGRNCGVFTRSIDHFIVLPEGESTWGE